MATTVTEVGSDIVHIQDEDILRKMWRQTEDTEKKKEIRMRMYKLREQRLRDLHTPGEMIHTETASKRSSTRTHTDSIADQGFMTVKSKEIRDSESPTDEYQRLSNSNKNVYVSSKTEIADDCNNRMLSKTEQTIVVKPTEEIKNSYFQTSSSNSMESKWESSQTTISVSEEVQKVNINSSSKFSENERNIADRQLTYDTSFDKQIHEDRNISQYDSSSNKQNIEDNSYSTSGTSVIKQSNEDRQFTHDNSFNVQQSSNFDTNIIESSTSSNVDSFNREDNSRYTDNDHQKHFEVNTSTSNDDYRLESSSDNVSNKNNTSIDNVYTSNISTEKSNKVETKSNNETVNELQNIDSYLSTQKSTTGLSIKPNATVSNEEQTIKKIDDQTTDLSKKNIKGQYTTTYNDSYQQPRISVELSPSHEAFARSLRSTPERSSPSPSRDRFSPERRLKSVSPDKYRASPEKAGSPPKSLRSTTRRKLSSTYTKDITKKRANTPTRGDKHDSSDDSDCSAATHGTYDKYKGNSAKKTLFKEEIKITSTSKSSAKSPSTSPVRREKSPGYSSEGSVGKEVKKSSTKVKSSSHESSPERSAFKPVNNYRITKSQDVTQNNETNIKLREEIDYTNNKSKIDASKLNNLVKVIKPEIIDDSDDNAQLDIDNNSSYVRDSKDKSVQEKFIIEEQVYNSSEQVHNAKITKKSTEINKKNREKSPSKEFGQGTKLIQENEKSKEPKDEKKITEVLTVNLKEQSPVKEVKPVPKEVKTFSTVKSSEKLVQSPNKNQTPSKNAMSAIPSSIKKPISSEKTLNKNIVHKDSKDNLLHKTVKKDLSREKVDIKITRNDSKTLIHKNSKENVTPRTVVKKPSQEFIVDKKTTISYRNKVNISETKPKTPEPTRVIEKKDSKTKLRPSLSPQSSQKKLGIIKSSADTKSITENTNSKKIPSKVVTKPKTFTTTKSNISTTPSKGTKLYSKNTQSVTTKNEIKKTTPSYLNQTKTFEVTKNVELKSNDQIEDQLLPDNFESDSELDDSTESPRCTKNNLSNSSSSSSSSSEDEAIEDQQKIKELDNIRIRAEEEYGIKMTNKDALLNVSVQLPPSSRESSPEYSARFGRPYSTVSDDASLPRYADVVSEPEDVNDFKLNGNRYDIVTDLDEDTNVTVADRVSKFLHSVNKQEEIKTTEIPQSPQSVRKAKHLFESIAKGQVEETDISKEIHEAETVSEAHDSSKDIKLQSSLKTGKISNTSDYKTRKDFFEKRTTDDKTQKTTQEKPLTPSITRSSSIKDKQASFEINSEKKTPLKDKTNTTKRTRSPESKNSSTDKTTKSPTRDVKTEIFDVKVEEINKSRRLSGSKTVKDRTACFEKNETNRDKSIKENKSTYRHQTANNPNVRTGRISDVYTKSAKISDSNFDCGSARRVTSPNRSKKSPQKAVVDNSIDYKEVSAAKSPERKPSKSPERGVAESSEQNVHTNNDSAGNRRAFDSTVSSRQKTTTTTVKTDYGVTVKNTTAPKATLATTKSTSINNADDEVSIEDIFDLHVLEIMLEKAVGYDRRRRIRAQIRVVKRELELRNEKETTTTSTTTTRSTKNTRNTSPAKTQKQSNVTAENARKVEMKNQKNSSPQKPNANLVGKSRSPSPQKTLRAVDETRSAVSQKTADDKARRSPSPPKKNTTAPAVEKTRSPSPQKNMLVDKARSPSPKKSSVARKQQESRSNRIDNSFQNSATVSKTAVTATSKVKSEQIGTKMAQEQNVTDQITSSYGVGPTDDNGRPLFGLRALRKTNTNQSLTESDISVHEQVDYTRDTANKTTVSVRKSAQNEDKGTRTGERTAAAAAVQRESRVTEQRRAGVDQLITDHKGKPLFGLKALQSVGKHDGEPSVYADSAEPPVSPQLRELVLKHEKHVEESSKLDTQRTQKPKAKFRDSFVYDTKDESSLSTFRENGFSDPNSITLRSIIQNTEDDTQNETTVKSKSHSTVFQSKSVTRSDGSGNVSVTRDFLKGEMSCANDQEPRGKLTRGHYTYRSPDAAQKAGVARATTVTASVGGGKNCGPEITEVVTEEQFDDESDRVDGGNRAARRSLTNGKFESIQKRFSQESFDRDSGRRSSRETANGCEKTDESAAASKPKTSLVRGNSIKALQHKFQQATVSSSLKRSKSTKSDSSAGSSSARQIEEKPVTTKVNTPKSGGPTSFLDNSSRVTGVQDVLTRMRNADLVVESGDTNEDIEARALLNKFLGASVILHGMEQGAKSPTASSPKAATTTSASLVNQVEKQRAQKSPAVRKNLSEQELSNIWDEKQLQILLESSSDYDQRKKIRARIRQIMAEQKACVDVVALAHTDSTATTASSSKTNQVTESSSTSSMSSKTEASSYVKTEVHTTRTSTSSSSRSTRASNDSFSPFAKFQQLERQNSAPKTSK